MPPTMTSSVPSPTTRNAPRLPMRWIIQAKFCPKKPVRKDSGRKIVAMRVSCFMIALSRFDTVDR